MTLLLPRRTAVAGTLLGVAFLGWLLALGLLGSVGGPAAAEVVSESAFVLFGSFAAACAGLAARRGAGRGRAAWTCIAVGAAAWALGNAYRSLHPLWSGPLPFPSPADAGFLALPIAAGLALLLLPVGQSRLSAARLLMDGLIVAGSLFLICWVTVLQDLLATGGARPFAFAVTLAYPILDVVVGTIGVLMLIRARGPARLSVALLLGAVVLMAVSNDVYFRLLAQSSYTRGDLLDAGWAASMLAFGFAALASFRAEPVGRAAPRVTSWLPYLALAVAGTVVVENLFDPVSAVMLTVAAALVIAVLFRQFLVVGQNQRLLAIVADQALRDPLTGLANRLLFRDRLMHAVDLHEREAFGVLAVMSLDLDDFKLVNDGLGHAAGDTLLVEVAKRIVGAVRSGDTVARLGGDEFAILIEQGTDRPDLVAQRVVEAFDEPFAIDGHMLSVRPSVGLSIASANDRDIRADDLLKESDLAMYAAKRSRTAGVQTIGTDTKLGPVLRRGVGGGAPIELLGDLRRAIDHGDLAMVYQPKIELASDAVVGVEALVRWPHPDRGLLKPAEFLPVVRANGLMDALTETVFEKTLADAVGWRRGGQSVPVAINLFAPSFDDMDLSTRLTVALADHGLAPAGLTLEITEDLVLQDFSRTRTVLEQLRESGMRVAVDDFGCGYSGLQYLRELRIDEVKLDRQFIMPIIDDPRAASIVRAVIDLAHDLEVICVAEGVENSAIVELLKVYGCDVAQGYHYSPPVAASSLLDTLMSLEPASAKLEKIGQG